MLAAGLGVAAVVLLGVVFYVGSTLAKPVHSAVGPTPAYPPADAVSFASSSGSQLRAWFARREEHAGGIVLLHGIRANRTTMLDRGRFLYDAGYSVLLVDLQAHGESTGDKITFGHLEALDAQTAVGFLRRHLPDEPIAALGSSLGGAACVLGPEPLDVDALVLEAVYPDVRQAVRNRLRIRFGKLGAWLAPLLTLQLKPRLGIDLDDLRPVAKIANARAPVLIIAGEQDERTTLADSQQLFDAAPQPKELWVVPGARHVDFHRYAQSEYELPVLQFLQQHLRARG